MSVLAPEVHNELAQLLDALQSSDNSVRSQAEEHLANNWTTNKPNMLLMGLVEQIQGSNDPTVTHIKPAIYCLLLIFFGILDPLFCCSHFPPNSFQGSQDTERRDGRTIPLSATRGRLHHQIQIAGSFGRRNHQPCPK